ncbi:recombinase family protein [Bradyrhizobium sp. 168]|uniref:recombinase family protein n=1 Tax=unclassified Bradyrhizobium TaxID=2631580 RepID=UPI0020508D8A|nr:recombinase family protein [Bradyrhizobium sp. 168]UPK15545.1 recombinase family protein [Bradyrhizobium sp. 155]UPK23085.1 recombinase family protein [Bradyrhizobium sp. 131]
MPRAYSYLRMSTAPQLKGDSRRRQLEASRTYAAAQGLELAGDAELEDIGVSAFKGDIPVWRTRVTMSLIARMNLPNTLWMNQNKPADFRACDGLLSRPVIDPN